MLPSDARLVVPQFKLDLTGHALRVYIDDALFFFPDLAYQPETRASGPGLVVDRGVLTGMPAAGVTGRRPMSSPIRATAHHDDQYVRVLEVDMDPAVILESLGREIDRTSKRYADLHALQTFRATLHQDLVEHPLPPLDAGTEESAEDEAARRKRRRSGPLIRRR